MSDEKLALNLPVLDLLAGCKNLLIAGMGGGFDIFCGLPIYLTLKQRGMNVHLANLSFSEIGYGKHTIRLTESLVGVQAHQKSFLPYFPELHLTRWLQEKRGDDATVWCFAKTGARRLTAEYRLPAPTLPCRVGMRRAAGYDKQQYQQQVPVGPEHGWFLSLVCGNALRTVRAEELLRVGLLGAMRGTQQAFRVVGRGEVGGAQQLRAGAGHHDLVLYRVSTGSRRLSHRCILSRSFACRPLL
ncbi:MAG: hypothetical protein JWL77_4393 [Chthonomonadaceae bacterium]|nr:hypothetical protein [Chthonomonadaceae bacterium]